MPAAMSVGGSLCTGLLGEERSGGDFIVFTRTKQLALRCVFKNPGLIKVNFLNFAVQPNVSEKVITLAFSYVCVASGQIEIPRLWEPLLCL